MTAKARLVVAVLLMALGDASLDAASARPEENCLAAPKTRPPRGSHWHYRTDTVKQSKCWYLWTEGHTSQNPAAQKKPETGVTTQRLAAGTSKTATDKAWPETQQLVQAGPAALNELRGATQDIAQAGGQAETVAMAWPDLASPTGAGKLTLPNPPSPASGATRGATAESTPEDRANQTREVPATATNSGKDAVNDVARPIEVAASHSEMSVGMLWAFAIGLVIAGIFVRRIVKMTFKRRRTVRTDLREPVWTRGMASERTTPKFKAHHRDMAPGSVDGEGLDDEIKEALRKLLRVLDRQAV